MFNIVDYLPANLVKSEVTDLFVRLYHISLNFNFENNEKIFDQIQETKLKNVSKRTREYFCFLLAKCAPKLERDM
jgi:hypothetical protein